jgi:hypothetical protein
MFNSNILISFLFASDCFFSECSFVTKILNAQKSGVLGAIVMDNDRSADDYFVDMMDDLTERNVQIPAMFLQYRDGYDYNKSLLRNMNIFVS